MAPLKRSGLVIWIHRDPGETYDGLDTEGRPLAQEGKAAFLKRFSQREPIYRFWADYEICACSSPEETVDAILEVLS